VATLGDEANVFQREIIVVIKLVNAVSDRIVRR
jgi:hypothetical protein